VLYCGRDGSALPTNTQQALDAAAKLIEETIRLDSRHSRAWLAKSIICWLSRRHEDAIGAVQRALEIEPDFGEAHAVLGQYKIVFGDVAAADEALRLAEALHPGSVEIQCALGELDYLRRDYENAAQHYRRVLEDSSGLDIVRERLAFCCFKCGSYAETIRLLADLPSMSMDSRLLLARSFARSGEWANALAIFNGHPLKSAPPAWNYYYAAALAANSRHADAAKLLTALVDDAKWGAKARRQLAHVALLQGDHQRAANLYGSDGSAAFDLGRLALLRRDWPAARKLYESATTNGQLVAARLGAALASAKMGDARDLQQLETEESVQVATYEALGDLAFAEHQYVKGVNYYERVLKARGTATTKLLHRLASGYLQLGRDRDALPHLVELHKRSPDDLALAKNLAICRFRVARANFGRERWEAARREFREAHSILAKADPKAAAVVADWELEATYRALLAVANQKSDSPTEWKRAAELCGHGVKHAPGDGRWQFASGIVQAMQGNFVVSTAFLSRAHELAPERTAVTLALALSLHHAGKAQEAQTLLENLLSTRPDAEHTSTFIAAQIPARFALAMSSAAGHNWPQAAAAIQPLLDHPLVVSSDRIRSRDVAEAVIGYELAAGRREQARVLIQKYAPEMAAVADLLTSVVQADAGDYLGAAAVLERTVRAKFEKQADKASHRADSHANQQAIEMYATCMVAAAAAAVLRNDVPFASQQLQHAIAACPAHTDAIRLRDAISMSTNLRALDLGQLDSAIAQCESVLKTGNRSPDLLRNVGCLYHRRAVGAELRNSSPQQRWKECVAFWRDRIIGRTEFWATYMASYNAGKTKREQLKDSELPGLCSAIAERMATFHLGFAAEFQKRNATNRIVEHLNLAWEWSPELEPDQSLLADLVPSGDMNDRQAEGLEAIAGQVNNKKAKTLLKGVASRYWFNKGVRQANEAQEAFLRVAQLARMLPSAARGDLGRARDRMRQAITWIGRGVSLSPDDADLRKSFNDAKEVEETMNGICRQIGV
jgi:tetratricopeptide (TPR) repeat protein